MSAPYAVVFNFRSEHDLSAAVFSAAVDSARARLRTRERGIPVVLVDDCSPGAAWRAALEAYERAEEVTVLRMGPPVLQSALVRTAPAEGYTSFGQAPAVDRGLWWARHRLGCSRALVLDGDAVVWGEDAEARVDAAMALLDDPLTVIAGDWVGTPPDWDRSGHTAGVYWHEGPSGREPKAERTGVPAPIRAYGYIPMICAAVDLEAFWDPRAGTMYNSGWVSNVWYYSQVALGRRSAYFPFFRAGTVAHIGRVAVSLARGWPTFGNDYGERRYGGKGEGNYHAGYLQAVSREALAAALAARAPGAPLAAPGLFVAPRPFEPNQHVPHLRYAAPVAELWEDQTVGLEWCVGGAAAASMEVRLAGDDVFVERCEGAESAALYRDFCEHAVAFLRPNVWTRADLYARLGGTRTIRTEGEWAVWGQTHHIRSAIWRWADHFGWDALGAGLLDPSKNR